MNSGARMFRPQDDNNKTLFVSKEKFVEKEMRENERKEHKNAQMFAACIHTALSTQAECVCVCDSNRLYSLFISF